MKVFLIVAAAVFVSCASGAPHHGGKDNMKCDGVDLKFTDEVVKAQETCRNKYFPAKGEKTDEKKTKDHKGPHVDMSCMAVCDFQGYGVIAADGKVVKDNIAPFVKANFPATVQDSLTTALNKCADEKGAALTLSADGKCDNYKPLIMCAHESLRTACKWEKPEKKDKSA